MTIETKYNIGDSVYTIIDNDIKMFPISGIQVDIIDQALITETEVRYILGYNERAVPRAENKVFKTKEELFKSFE